MKGGIEATALIKESDRAGAAFGQFSDFEILNRFGKRKYRFALEVRVPGRDPYEVEGEFEVPRKVENTGLFPGRIGKPLSPGLELPVRVDPSDATSLEIDWDKYHAAHGRKDAQDAATQSATNRQYAEMLKGKPKVAEQLIAGNRLAVRGWAAAVRSGNMSREDFEAQVTHELECGRMDPADAEAARKGLDGAV